MPTGQRAFLLAAAPQRGGLSHRPLGVPQALGQPLRRTRRRGAALLLSKPHLRQYLRTGLSCPLEWAEGAATPPRDDRREPAATLPRVLRVQPPQPFGHDSGLSRRRPSLLGSLPERRSSSVRSRLDRITPHVRMFCYMINSHDELKMSQVNGGKT